MEELDPRAIRHPTRKLLLKFLAVKPERPKVLSQLSSQVKKDHRTVWYHLHILEKYGLVEHIPTEHQEEARFKHKFTITEEGLGVLRSMNE